MRLSGVSPMFQGGLRLIQSKPGPKMFGMTRTWTWVGMRSPD
jgi:hypothetical protein